MLNKFQEQYLLASVEKLEDIKDIIIKNINKENRITAPVALRKCSSI